VISDPTSSPQANGRECATKVKLRPGCFLVIDGLQFSEEKPNAVIGKLIGEDWRVIFRSNEPTRSDAVYEERKAMFGWNIMPSEIEYLIHFAD